MKGAWTFTMALVAAGLLTLTAPPSDAEQSNGGTAPKVTEGKSGEPGSSEAGIEQGQTKQNRRSSEQQLTEDRTTDEKAKSGKSAPRSEGKSSGTRSEIGSGGGGVTGATGR